MKSEDQLSRIRHSLAHLLAAAVLELYPGTKNTIGPSIENGFYYDFDLPFPVSDKDLPKIEKKMRELLKAWKEFSREEVSEARAKEFFKTNPYKIELIDEIVRKKERLTLYASGAFTDLCRGGHVARPAEDISPDSFALDRVAGAYWRGDEKNKMLTRIYGLAFETKAALEQYRTMRAEAEKRDHKKLGKELDLFVFSDLVGAGLPLWTPKGALVRNLLDDFVWQLRRQAGYERVEIPHITKKELYEKSGHWDKFKNELFRITTREGHEFAMKPMNCPHHTQIYARALWSYRDLPQRYANTTMCYRDEQTGELSGLSRVRAFAQDDAHVFCRMSQAKEEFEKIWSIIHAFYESFGFALRVRLSLHDKDHPEKYLGDAEKWEFAENFLREIASGKKTDWFESRGEAAFYGPKLDFMAKDALGREWQVATVQLDMNMPERFDLVCVNEKGGRERIVMIHAAIMGSIERFLSILIEHTAGALPLWLSPVQAEILPISEKQNGYAEKAEREFLDAGIRVELDRSNESLGKKIRAARLRKIPYWIVIGEKEVAAEGAALESRDRGSLGQLKTKDAIGMLVREIKNKRHGV